MNVETGMIKNFSKAMFAKERNAGIFIEADKKVDAFLSSLVKP